MAADLDGKVTAVITDINRPNGLTFSPDGKILYVVEGGASPRMINAYDVVEDGGTPNPALS